MIEQTKAGKQWERIMNQVLAENGNEMDAKKLIKETDRRTNDSRK